MSEAANEVRNEVLEALRFMRARDYATAIAALETGLTHESINAEERAILYSTLGMILKKQGKLNEAEQAYQNAEQCLPHDPVLALIVARFLLQEKRAFDQVISRCKAILKIVGEVPSFRHQAYTLAGLAYLGKKRPNKAVAMLRKSMLDDFVGMISSENIDFNLAEALLRQGIEVKTCQRFVELAYNLAYSKREYTAMAQYRQILDSFESTNIT